MNQERISSTARTFFLYLLRLFLFSLPIMVVAAVPTASPAVDSKILAAQFLLPWLFVCFVPVLVRAVRQGRGGGLDGMAFIAVVVSGLLSCILSSRSGYSFHSSWHSWMIVGLGYAVLVVGPTVVESRKLIVTMVAAAIACTLYGLGIYFGYDPLHPLFPFAPGQQESRSYIHSFLGNPEYFGGYMAPIASLAFCQVLRAGSRTGTRLAWLACCLVFLLVLVLSGARGALIGFGVAVAICLGSQVPLLAADMRRGIVRLLWGAGIAIVVLITIFSFPNPLNYRGSRLARRFVEMFDLTSPSVRERIFFFAISGRMIADNPVFGDGPGTFRLNFYPYVEKLSAQDPRAGVQLMASYLQNRIAEHAHCDYLEIWCETGVVGIAAHLFVMTVAVLGFARSRRTTAALAAGGDSRARALAQELFLLRTGYVAAAACVFANAAFSFPLHMPVRASLAWVCLGAYFSACRHLEAQAVCSGLVPERSTIDKERSCHGIEVPAGSPN